MFGLTSFSPIVIIRCLPEAHRAGRLDLRAEADVAARLEVRGHRVVVVLPDLQRTTVFTCSVSVPFNTETSMYLTNFSRAQLSLRYLMGEVGWRSW